MTETPVADPVAAGPANAPANGAAPSFARHTLPNGLTVLTREVHSAPVVSFWIWYRVGTRNERSGITGISHWVEHMLFKGTPNLPKGSIHGVVAANGGVLNGLTWDDFTTYFETLPSDRWELALRIESDRIANASFDPDEVGSERTVIISEREGHENDPDFNLAEEVTATAFKVHPYGAETIGWKCDLLTMTRDDLYNHYKTYYAPNNAIVVAVGDFDTAALLGRVEAAFGGYEPSPAIPPVRSVEPPQLGERRVTVRMPGATGLLQAVYHAPPAGSPDVYPLMVADAVLSGAKAMGFGGGAALGRSARLYRALVVPEIATGASSYFRLTRDPHLFHLGASARPDQPAEEALARIEQALFAEIDRLAQEPPPAAEVEKAIRQARAQFVYAGESVTNLGYVLGYLEIVDTAELYDHFLDRLAAVTPADVQRVVRQYLSPNNRTVGWFIPPDPAPAESSAAPPNGASDPTE
jgi:zinc protease